MTMRNGCRRLMVRATGDGGFTLPTVMLMVFAAFAVASATVLSSLTAQHGTSRDLATKDALAGAEAGAHEAMLRYNATTVASGTWGRCLPEGTTPAAVDTSGWACVRLSRPSFPTGRLTRTGWAFRKRHQVRRCP